VEESDERLDESTGISLRSRSISKSAVPCKDPRGMVRGVAGHEGQQWVTLPGAPAVFQSYFDGIQTVMVATKQLRGTVLRRRGGVAPSGFHKNGLGTLDGPEISIPTDVEELGQVEHLKEADVHGRDVEVLDGQACRAENPALGPRHAGGDFTQDRP